MQVRSTARELYDEFFKAAEAKPRGVVSKLCAIVEQLESAFARQLSQIKVRVLSKLKDKVIVRGSLVGQRTHITCSYCFWRNGYFL